VNRFQLQTVGIGEENGVVAGSILGILRGRVENGGSFLEEKVMKRINVGSLLHFEREMMKSDAIAIEGDSRELGSGGPKRDRELPVGPGGVFGVVRRLLGLPIEYLTPRG
jgi:hypothetical protein